MPSFSPLALRCNRQIRGAHAPPFLRIYWPHMAVIPVAGPATHCHYPDRNLPASVPQASGNATFMWGDNGVDVAVTKSFFRLLRYYVRSLRWSLIRCKKNKKKRRKKEKKKKPCRMAPTVDARPLVQHHSTKQHCAGRREGGATCACESEPQCRLVASRCSFPTVLG